jgi:acyl-coenzyme A thioesterase PaaI-like protein
LKFRQLCHQRFSEFQKHKAPLAHSIPARCALISPGYQQISEGDPLTDSVNVEKDTAYDPRADGWIQESTPAFLTLIGPIWRKQANTQTVFGLLAELRHANHRRIVHGGTLMTLANYAAERICALSTDAKAQATIQIDVQFVSASEIGDFIISGWEIVRRTSSLVFMRGDLSAGSRRIAAVSGVWKIAKPC